MFFKNDHRKKSGGGIVRLFLSLVIMAILGVGLLQAYRSFSGVDPLSLSPQTSIKSLLNSESLYNLLISFLTVSPEQSVNKVKQLLDTGEATNTGNSQDGPSGSILQFKFAVVADSHIDYGNLKKALTQAKNSGAKFIIGIGDFSDVGTVDELVNSKLQFDAVDLPYYVTPGDHDLWDSRDKKKSPDQNFREVFKSPTFQSFSYENTRFIIVYNADNYFGLDDFQLRWLEDELNRVQSDPSELILAFVDIPLFHPSSDHIMGKSNPKLKNQAAHLASLFKKHQVKEVVAADTHLFSRYKEPSQDLAMMTVGAVTSAKNTQPPRFVMVDVYDDGSYNITDTEIK